MGVPSRSPSLEGRRVLIVEDEWFVVTELVEFLSGHGAIVVGPASSVEDGLAFARIEPLDGAILNISLHDRYSYPIADVLRQRGVPFAFATGIDDWAIPPAYLRVPYVSKPYEATSVAEALFGRQEPRDACPSGPAS